MLNQMMRDRFKRATGYGDMLNVGKIQSLMDWFESELSAERQKALEEANDVKAYKGEVNYSQGQFPDDYFVPCLDDAEPKQPLARFHRLLDSWKDNGLELSECNAIRIAFQLGREQGHLEASAGDYENPLP